VANYMRNDEKRAYGMVLAGGEASDAKVRAPLLEGRHAPAKPVANARCKFICCTGLGHTRSAASVISSWGAGARPPRESTEAQMSSLRGNNERSGAWGQ